MYLYRQKMFVYSLSFFLCVIAAAHAAVATEVTTPAPLYPGNVLQNPSFEVSGKITPAYWVQVPVNRGGAYEYFVSDTVAHEGKKSLAIKGTAPGRGMCYNPDVYVVGGATYRLACWVKTQGTGVSAVVSLAYAGVNLNFQETPDWTRLEGEFTAEKTGKEILQLTSHGVGTVFLDDISITMLSQPAQNTQAQIPVTDGKPLSRIVIPDDCSLTAYTAAFEVRRVLNEMTGSELPVVMKSSITASDTGSIYIDCAPDMTDYAGDLASVGDEGIVLDINDDGDIVCLGNTLRGVYYAVQELFYLLDCRWYTPWEGGECIPRASTLNLTNQKIVHDPSFTLRGYAIIHHYFTPPQMTNNWIDRDGWWQWEARNRINGFKTDTTFTDPGYIYGNGAKDISGHSLHTIVDPGKYFASHPEYFPLIDGVRTATTPWAPRPSQVCVSNPEVIQICADYIISHFDAYPGADRVHIGQMDGCTAHCECGPCLALDPPGSVNWDIKKTHINRFTDRWLWFINQIADIVKQSHPDKFVSSWAYGEFLTRPINPENNPRDNVIIELSVSFTNLQDNSDWRSMKCFKHKISDRRCKFNVEGMQVLKEWADLAPLAIYSYYSHYNNRGTAGSYCHADADFYRSLHDAGVRRINDEVGTDTLSAPLLLNLRNRILWDIDTDVDKYIDDFCTIVYGPASKPIKQYFAALESAISRAPQAHVTYNDFGIFKLPILANLNRYLDRAHALATNDTTLQARIARLRISMCYTEIKVLQNTSQEIGVDLRTKNANTDVAKAKAKRIAVLKTTANKLVKQYNIPVMDTVWPVLVQ